MAKSRAVSEAPMKSDAPPVEYTVVARRYRPQQLTELIGQEHVATALINALKADRVAHAYLFTGARGVGKTSAARILAKTLNCVNGPTPTPCDRCESCIAIASGEDVDVLEIDGASNNKVEEIRELRQNVGFRPTRSRYKIYIIDEVHMLTTGSFNALLKTLEEPPPHVKFILATTEVQKIPVTILSRCQRFDFANVAPAKIFEQLKRIAEREGIAAEDEALQLIARRAAGSMRDSQSLLDQMLSAAIGSLTAQHVHTVLGTAGDDRVLQLARAIVEKDAKTALTLLPQWLEQGMQISELVDQLVEYWRCLMLVNSTGSLPDVTVSPNMRAAVAKQATSFSLDAILAGLEVLTTTKARMRGNNHALVLLEMAIARLSRIENLVSITDLMQSLSKVAQSSSSGANIASKGDPTSQQPTSGIQNDRELKKNAMMPLASEPKMVENEIGEDQVERKELVEANLREFWESLLKLLSNRAPILSAHLKNAHLPAIFAPNSLAIRFSTSYSQSYGACNTEVNIGKLIEAVRVLSGEENLAVRFELVADTVETSKIQSLPTPATRQADRRKNLLGLPLFKRAVDVLGAQIAAVDDEFNPIALPPKLAVIEEDDPEGS